MWIATAKQQVQYNDSCSQAWAMAAVEWHENDNVDANSKNHQWLVLVWLLTSFMCLAGSSKHIVLGIQASQPTDDQTTAQPGSTRFMHSTG